MYSHRKLGECDTSFVGQEETEVSEIVEDNREADARTYASEISAISRALNYLAAGRS